MVFGPDRFTVIYETTVKDDDYDNNKNYKSEGKLVALRKEKVSHI